MNDRPKLDPAKYGPTATFIDDFPYGSNAVAESLRNTRCDMMWGVVGAGVIVVFIVAVIATVAWLTF